MDKPDKPNDELRNWLVDLKSTFNTPSGERVFKKLWERYAMQPTAVHVGANNPLAIAHIGGQKELLLALHADLNANIEERVAATQAVEPLMEELENV